MIPTSYFYKDLYRRYWFGPEVASAGLPPAAARISLWQRLIRALAALRGLRPESGGERLHHRTATTLPR